MPLRIEVNGNKRLHHPEEKKGMIQVPNGVVTEEILVFGPNKDDTKSYIYRGRLTYEPDFVEQLENNFETMDESELFEKIAELSPGEKYVFKANGSNQRQVSIRFTHVKRNSPFDIP